MLQEGSSLASESDRHGFTPEARLQLEASVAIYRAFPNGPSIAIPLGDLAVFEAAEGNLEPARSQCVEALTIQRSVGFTMPLTRGIEKMASVEVACGGFERAALLLGAAEATRERTEVSIWPTWRAEKG